MSQGISWAFELIHKVSNPAKSMSRHLEVFEKTLHAGEGALHRFHDALEIVYEGGAMLREGFYKLKEAGAELIDGMAFKQNSLIGLQAMVGTRDAAIEVFEGVEQFAWQTGQTVASVMQTTKDLLSSGFDPEAVDSLRLMLSDMAVVDPGKASSIAAIIGEIGRRGEMTGRQIKSLSDAGLDATMMWEELAKATGIGADVLKKMEGIAFKAGTAVSAAYAVGVKKYSDGVVGSRSDQVSRTLPALLKKVLAIPERIFDELAGFNGGAGGGVLEKILSNIAAAFDPKSVRGDRIIESIRDLVSEMGRAFGLVSGPGGLMAELAGPNGPAKVEEIFARLVNWGRTDLIPFLVDVRDTVREIASVMAEIPGMSRRLRSPLTGALEEQGGTAGYLGQFNSKGGAVKTGWLEAAWNDLLRTSTNENDPDSWLNQKRRAVAADGGAVSSVPVTVHIHGNASKDDVRRGVHEGVTSAIGDRYLLEMGAAGAR